MRELEIEARDRENRRRIAAAVQGRIMAKEARKMSAERAKKNAAAEAEADAILERMRELRRREAQPWHGYEERWEELLKRTGRKS